MTDIAEIINVSISLATATPTRPSFGVPLLLVNKVPASWGANRVRTFSSLTDVTAAGFLTTDPAYKMATVVCAQSPRPTQFKIAKRVLPCTQSIQLVCTSAVAGDIYSITVLPPASTTATVITYTVPGSSTTTAVGTAIAALIAAVSGFAATSVTGTITVTATTPTLLFDLQAWSSNFQLKDNTTDPGIATDLANTVLEDNAWYGLLLDYDGNATIAAAATWAEANRKIYCWDTSDYGASDPASTTDAGYLLKQSAVQYSPGWFNGSAVLKYLSAGIMAKQFCATPGSDTWAFKTVAGVAADTLKTGQTNALKAKNINFYVPVSGLNDTLWGTCPSGQFIDVVRLVDWTISEIQIRAYQKIKNSPKLPYTDKGIDVIRATTMSVFLDGIDNGGYVYDSQLFVSVPAAATVDSISKGSRLVPNITFGCRLAGAIHSAVISGTLVL